MGGQAQLAVFLELEVVQAAGVAGGNLGFDAADAGQRAADVFAHHAGGQVDDDAGAGFADGVDDALGHIRVPRRHVAKAILLVAHVDVHDAGTRVEGVARFGRHLRGVTGTGCCLGLVSTPVSAQVSMAFSIIVPNQLGTELRLPKS